MNEVCETFSQKDQVGVTDIWISKKDRNLSTNDKRQLLSDIARSCTQAINPPFTLGKKTVERTKEDIYERTG